MAHLEVKPKSRSSWWIWLILIIIILAAAFYFWNGYTVNRSTLTTKATDSAKTTSDSATVRQNAK